jgi:hypothetical protein
VSFREVNENGQADIAGVPDEQLKLWSKRAASIDAEAGPKIAEYEKILGRTLSSSERAGVVKTAVLKTRAAKQHGQLSALHATWTAEAARAGWTPHRLRQAVGLRVARTRPGPEAEVLPSDAEVLPNSPAYRSGLARPTEPVPPGADRSGPQHPEPVLPAPPAVLPAEPTAAAGVEAEVAAMALQAAGTRRAVFSRADVAGQVAAQLPTAGLSAAEVVARIEQFTDAALGLEAAVPIGQQTVGVTLRASDARYATVQVLNAEARILDLATRGRRSDFGRVPLTALMPKGRDGGLDPSQYRAVLQLAGGGDFVSVLTAPAGAGKTSTLGAAARAWQDAGYRVVGLAPSARAAAELATATGGPADTLAKWLHTHQHTHQHAHSSAPAGAQGATALDDRTVVILDEASMASTLDLDPLITAAARAGAKVVLVGDPAQIGVVNGPGGMLAALARAGHGVELNRIHRFSHTWERSASLALRDGTAGALAAYRLAGRLHPCADGDTALDGVFAHWAAARADGQDALMLARTRLDVDALNLRARAAALTAGEVAGPVTVAGERQWQAGDLLRARRNDRRLTVGDGHVRNGDRYRVLGAGPDGALLVEDLSGRGRTILPAAYLAEHADYGWASTIDGAQGATADVGIVLARPGLDREHLYVAMTRGRHANHAYITPDPSTEDDHHHGHPHQRHGVHAEADPQEQAVQVLQAALTHSGAQDAAHTALEHARTQAAQTVRQQERHAELAAARERAAATLQRRQDRPLTAEHVHAVRQLEQWRTERDQLRADRDALHRGLQHAQTELEALPRWARSRRRTLTETITSSQQRLHQTGPTQASLDAEVDRLTRQVAHHTRQRARDLADPPPSGTPDLIRAVELAWPRPAGPGAREPFSTALAAPQNPYRGPERDTGSGLSR